MYQMPQPVGGYQPQNYPYNPLPTPNNYDYNTSFTSSNSKCEYEYITDEESGYIEDKNGNFLSVNEAQSKGRRGMKKKLIIGGAIVGGTLFFKKHIKKKKEKIKKKNSCNTPPSPPPDVYNQPIKPINGGLIYGQPMYDIGHVPPEMFNHKVYGLNVCTRVVY